MLNTIFAIFAVLCLADGPEKTIADFTLKDNTGKALALANFKDKKAVVVIFLGTQCPINNLYVPRLGELHKEFAGQGVQFLGINSNRQDSFEDMAEHAKRNEIPFPVLRDEGGVIADRFGAQKHPEAFVLDEKRVIRYQGRIDDRFGFGFQRKEATRRDLAESLTEILAGKKVTMPTTAVSGCYIGRAPRTRDDGPITFAKHISPILQKNCQECHRPGQIGPMPLLKYDDVVSWSAMIKDVVEDRRMPPWYADPRHGKFENDRTLPKQQRDQLLAWIANGMPRGQDKDMPPAVKFPEGWSIGKPDMVIELPREISVPAEMPARGIPYEFFYVDPKFEEDTWIERAEARPGAPEVVHHILVFVVPPGKVFIPGSPATPVLTGMAPGESPLVLGPGMAKMVPKGSRLLFQMHYTPNGRAQKDRSSIGLIFAKEPPKKVVITQPVFNSFFRIPPGDDNHEVRASFTFDRDGYVIGYMPHMHLRGKDFLVQATYPDKREETLLLVPRFNFNWQSIYRLSAPKSMPKGTRITCVAHFDNSKNNLSNPDPSRTVYWGDQTWQEMMIGWIDFAYDRQPDEKK